MSDLLTTDEYRCIAKGLSLPEGAFIDGAFRPARSGATFETRNPATGELLANVAACGAEDVDFAVQKARDAFEDGHWSRLHPAERLDFGDDALGLRQIHVGDHDLRTLADELQDCGAADAAGAAGDDGDFAFQTHVKTFWEGGSDAGPDARRLRDCAVGTGDPGPHGIGELYSSLSDGVVSAALSIVTSVVLTASKFSSGMVPSSW